MGSIPRLGRSSGEGQQTQFFCAGLAVTVVIVMEVLVDVTAIMVTRT